MSTKKATVLIALVAASALAGLGAAMAQSLGGGCTVAASSDLDTTTMVDATRADPFRIDPQGSIAWNASSPGPIMNHTWVINVEVGGFGVPVARGGDPNTAGTQQSVGERSIPALVSLAEASGVPNANLLGSLRGIYRVFGDIAGDGGNCAGDAYVLIEGNPLSETFGQIAAAITGLGLLLMIWSGFGKG